MLLNAEKAAIVGVWRIQLLIQIEFNFIVAQSTHFRISRNVTIANCIIFRVYRRQSIIIPLHYCRPNERYRWTWKALFIATKFVQIRFALKIHWMIILQHTQHRHKTLELDLHLMCAQISAAARMRAAAEKNELESFPLDFIESFNCLYIFSLEFLLPFTRFFRLSVNSM